MKTNKAICFKQSEKQLSEVYGFWNTEACGTHLAKSKRLSREFYQEYSRLRYDVEWHIPLLVPFADAEGKKVLEIGCGNGTDGVMFALAGADYTGVDLTPAAVEATRIHFECLGLRGIFQVENAEKLTFADESFDFIYSHGVLHHTPNPSVTFAEVFRVLKPGGQAVLMLYHKHSFNYYVRILGYMRARVLFQILTRLGQFSADRSHLTERLKGVRGNTAGLVWRTHYENFLRFGWSYLRAKNFVHHATDGPECPIAFVYTAKSVQRAFSQFCSVKTRVAHFPMRKHQFTKWMPFALERWMASRIGWYLFVYLTK